MIFDFGQRTAYFHVDHTEPHVAKLTLFCKETAENIGRLVILFFKFIYCIFTIYSRYLKRVIGKRDECVYLKQIPSSDGSLDLI
jgi:hypothetical protein